jgi:hypothetical protein
MNACFYFGWRRSRNEGKVEEDVEEEYKHKIPKKVRNTPIMNWCSTYKKT